MKPSLLCAIAALLSLSACASAARADACDHDRARAARERGDIRPVSEIMRAATAAVPGDVIGLELEHEHDAWRYEVKIIGTDGRLMEVEVDAADARVLGWEHD